MLSVHSFLGVALWWAAVNCSPTPIGTTDQSASGQTFTLEQIAVERTRPWSGEHAMRRDYLKYGLEPPPELEEAVRLIEEEAAVRVIQDDGGPGTGTVAAIPFKGDTEYLIAVQVGKHNLSLDLDTGSSDLWVMSNLQRSGIGDRPKNRVYDASTGQKLAGHSWQIRYGDQSGAAGDVYLDKVSIGDLTVPKQAVEAAVTVSGTFTKDGNNDGLLGLGFSRLNTIRPTKQKTWFDNIRPSLKAPLFTAALKQGAPGHYDFGFIDKAKYKGEIVYTPVTSPKGFWEFKVTGYGIGKAPPKDTDITAIADTGSSLWYNKPEVVKAYYEQVSYNGINGTCAPPPMCATCPPQCTFQCKSALPDVTLVISGKHVVIPGRNMKYQEKPGAKVCFGGMQPVQRGMPGMIFGDVFLKNMFVVHEAPEGGQARLGFASAA